MQGALWMVIALTITCTVLGVSAFYAYQLHRTSYAGRSPWFTGLPLADLEQIGIDGPQWLGDPDLALLSVAFVDVWKGIGIALVIFIAAILSIPEEYNDAVRLEGGAWTQFRHITVPLSRNATFTVILLSFIGGLRSFDLIWTMTRGGPAFSSDVLASTIYKQYQAGFYGLATAGNVILFVAVTLLVYPLMRWFSKRELEL